MAIADQFFQTAGALMTGAWGQPIIWRAWVASKAAAKKRTAKAKQKKKAKL